jgi:hypothetical protein
MKVIDNIKNHIPFELKRGSSLLSVAIALVIAGLLARLGEMILDGLVNIIRPFLPHVRNWFINIITFSFEVNLIGVVVFVISLFPIYRRIDRFFLKRTKGEIVFIDRFNAGNKGWILNYWGSHDRQKTNRIENSSMVFEATENDLVSGAFGAYFDLRNGIYQGNEYEVSCKVKSDENTTMEFSLWLHDTTGGDSSITTDSKTPSTSFEEFKLGFTANETQAIRIHLHNKPGIGRVIVDEVVVRKI